MEDRSLPLSATGSWLAILDIRWLIVASLQSVLLSSLGFSSHLNPEGSYLRILYFITSAKIHLPNNVMFTGSRD